MLGNCISHTHTHTHLTDDIQAGVEIPRFHIRYQPSQHGMQAVGEHMQLVSSGEGPLHLLEDVEEILRPQGSGHLHQRVPGYVADITGAVLERLTYFEQQAARKERREGGHVSSRVAICSQHRNLSSVLEDPAVVQLHMNLWELLESNTCPLMSVNIYPLLKAVLDDPRDPT